jgi:hypothetical protein
MNDLDHVGDPAGAAALRECLDEQTRQETAERGNEDPEERWERFRSEDDVFGVEQEARQLARESAEADRTERARYAHRSGEKKELGVGVAEEEPPEAGRAGWGRWFG